MFHIADQKNIIDGKMTDVYFLRTMEVLKAKKIDKWVKAEFIAKRFPEDYGWGILAGIEEAGHLLKNLKVSVRAMREGTIFRAFERICHLRRRSGNMFLNNFRVRTYRDCPSYD